jgi:transposase-like protein
MDKLHKDFLESYLKGLSVNDKKELFALLAADVYKIESNDKLTEASTNNSICPHCHSVKIIKRGVYLDKIQKFYCKECKKRFSLKTKTAFAYSKKDIHLGPL